MPRTPAPEPSPSQPMRSGGDAMDKVLRKMENHIRAQRRGEAPTVVPRSKKRPAPASRPTSSPDNSTRLPAVLLVLLVLLVSVPESSEADSPTAALELHAAAWWASLAASSR